MGHMLSEAKKIGKKVLPTSLYRFLVSAGGDCRRSLYALRSAGGCNILIPSIVLSVGQACNFRCRDCGNFAPYAPKEFLRYPIGDIIRDFEILFSFCNARIDHLQIQGGEPFCYSDLPALLEYLSDEKRKGNVGDITIATNGSVMPPDTLLDLIKENDIELRISDYNVARDKTEALHAVCRQRQLRYTFFDFATAQGKWYDCGGIDTPREDDDAIVSRRYKDCAFRGCLTLEHGELTYCSRATNSHVIQGFERREDDHFVLAEKEGKKEELRKYLADRRFMEACRYCNGTNDDMMVPPAIQLGAR